MPTVIQSGGPSGSPVTHGRTVIGAVPPTEASSGKPTIIGAPAPATQPRKPTQIGSASAPPTTNVPAPPAPRQATKPTVLPGKRLVRLAVTVELVRAANPATTSDAVLERAVAIAKATDLGSLCGKTALLWGQVTQERHGELVSESLELAQAVELEKSRRHVARIMEILEVMHLEKVFASAAKRGLGSLVAGITGRATSSVDSPQELEGALEELQQIIGLIRSLTDNLATLRDKIDANAKAIVANGQEVEASLCAATFLAGHIRANPADFRPETPGHLETRAASLTATLASIRGNGAVRQVQSDNPVSFIQLIQNVALVTLPQWLSALTAMKIAAASRKINQTEVGELADGLRQVTAELRQ